MPRPRGRPRDFALGETTPERILSTALELIAQQGFAATSIQQIADRLDLTKAALFYHFPTKNDLLLALVKPGVECLEQLVDRLEAATSPRSTAIASYVDLVAHHEQIIRILSQDPALLAQSDIVPRRDLYDRLAHLLISEGELTPTDQAQFRAALSGVHSVFVYAQPEDDREMLREMAIDSATAVLEIPRRSS